MISCDIHSLFKVTEVELIYRHKTKAANRPKVMVASDAYELLMVSWDKNKIELLEQFKILLLDRNKACMGMSEIATGGMSACIVDPKIVFATALKARAQGIILAHNHPSHNLSPSFADVGLTRKLHDCGRLLDIDVVDHLIVTPERYYSFAEEGLMP